MLRKYHGPHILNDMWFM